MRHHGYLAVALAGMTAAAGWILSQTDLVDASEEEASSFREVYSDSRDEVASQPVSSGLRLNYFDARWNRVLKDVAQHAKLTLVMDKVPPGRFARRDRTRYSTADCVRILNRELEGLGFRLVKQGEFLIVLNLDQARTRYARPLLPSGDAPAPVAADSDHRPFRPASARVDQLNARWASEANSEDDETEAVEQEPRETTTIPILPDVLQEPTSFVEVDDAAKESPAATVVRKVDIDHSTAAEVARAVYLVFERRSELLQKGIQELPTFVVYDANDADKSGEPLFRIGIDQQNDRLIVEADEKRAEHLVKLLHRLDKPSAGSADDDASKLMEAPDVTDKTARALNDQLRRLVAMRRQETPADPAATTDGASDIADTSAFNLRGDVNIQAMQELGVLMIEGNEEDVERLGPIIERLEQMSVGSLPDIHLLELQHVNSEAFAELLTSVYDRLAELRKRGEEERQSVAFYAVVQPNSVLILAPQLELPAILELAERLDTKLDPGSEFRVFELRNAIASQVVAGLENFYDNDDRQGLATRIRPLADVRTNSVIVQGHPRDLAEVGRLIEGLDRDKPGAVHKVKIIELNHATANELAEVLNSAIQAVTSPPQTTSGGTGGFGGNQGPQELRDTKSIALEFLSTNGDAQQLLRSGFLVDVRINADPRSNALIVSAPEASMTLLHALIETLDQPPSAIAAIKVFALQNADAEQSVELLTTMFENTNQEEQLGVQIAGAEDAASSLIPLQFSADIRTNTVLAVGSEEALSIVEAILLRLDTDDARQRTTTVIELRNSRAEDVAESINVFLEQQQTLQDSSDDLVSNVERLRQEAIVAPDFGSNSLIVSASPEYFSRITEIISNLDSNKPQVVIQALIVEVALDNTDEFGVELGFQDPLLFSRSILESADDLITIPTSTLVPGVGTVQSTTILTQNRTPGFDFNNTVKAIGNNAVGNTGAVGSQGISNFSLGRQNGDLGFGGFVFSAQSDAVNVLVRALAARRTLHVLSRPQIRATHNNTATIRVGQEVPVVNGVEVIQGGVVSPTIEQRNTGIILTVTPRITPDGSVVMELFAEKSRIDDNGVPIFTDVNNGNVIEAAILDVAIAETTVDVPNGQTIVIGGIITKSDETQERKVPWLGDLPVVGKAFRYDSTNTVRTELLIFLTPRIVYSDADAELIKQVESERLHFIESEAEEIHGPLYSVPAQGQPVLEEIVPGPESVVPETPFSDPSYQSELQDGTMGPMDANETAAEVLPQQVRRSFRSPRVQTASAQVADNAGTIKRARHESSDSPIEPSWVDRVFKRKPARRQTTSNVRKESQKVQSASTTESDLSELGFGDVEWK